MVYKLIAPGTRRNNKTFIVRGTVGGRRFEARSDATTQKAAHEWAKRYEARLEGETVSGPDVTFAQAAAAYAATKRLRKQDECYIERLTAWFRNRPIAGMVGADLITAAHALAGNTSDANKNRAVIGPASAILHYAAEQGWCNDRRHRRMKVSRRSPRRPAASETMRLLLDNTDGPKRLLLAWLYETGQRITASLKLLRDDLDLPRNIARVVSDKTDDHGMIELSPELVALLANAPHLPSGRVFPWGDRHNVYRWLKPLCARLGVSYTPHQSRHAMATDLRVLGYDMRAIAERGLWRDERSAERYVHHRSAAVGERGVVLLLKKEER